MNQDQLRAKSLALFHALVSNWANDLRKEVTGLQDDVLQKLDALQERMSKYEENIDEERILAFAAEAMGSITAAGGGGGGGALKKIPASLARIDEGSSLTEVLTLLLEQAAGFAPRVALFIIKGGSYIGWNGQGFEPGVDIKKISVPSDADTLFKAVNQSRATFHGETNSHRDNVQLLSRVGNVLPSVVFATPLTLRDRVAALVYADSGDASAGLNDAEAIEILTAYSSKLLDALSAQKASKTGEQPTPSASTPTSPPQVQAQPVRPPAPSPSPSPAPARGPSPQVSSFGIQEEEDEPGTIMFSTSEMQLPNLGTVAQHQAQAKAPAPAPAPAAKAGGGGPNLDALDPETRKKHEDAMRFARLLVSEIKLYNESKVQQGRASRDLYDVLRDDIERSRQLYKERVVESVRTASNYFNDELVRILADGDEGAMGQTMPAN